MTVNARSSAFIGPDHLFSRKQRMGPLGYKAFLFFMSVLIFSLASPGPAPAQDPVDTLDKIGRIINQAKEMVESIRDGDLGEKELLGELTARYSSNDDLDRLCRETCADAGEDTTIVEYHLIYSGLLGESRPIDLVKLVKEKLAADGFNILHEEGSGRRKTIWFDNRPAGQAREERYVLWISDGWFRKLTDFFSGRKTNRSFCLAKVAKI